MKAILYFKNCNSDAIAVTEVSQLNENNKTLKDSYGNIYENVIREENHNANQLLKGNLAFFIEDYGVENFQPVHDPIIPDPQLPNDNVELSDSVTPNRYGYIPNEIIVNHPRGWNLTKAYRDSLKVS